MSHQLSGAEPRTQPRSGVSQAPALNHTTPAGPPVSVISPPEPPLSSLWLLLSLWLSLNIFLVLFFSFSVSLFCLSLFHFLCLSPSLCFFLSPSVSVFLFPTPCLSLSLSLTLPVSLSPFLSSSACPPPLAAPPCGSASLQSALVPTPAHYVPGQTLTSGGAWRAAMGRCRAGGRECSASRSPL